MDKLRLDLAALEVDRLDVAVPSLSGGLETFGMGHASAELDQSCDGSGCDQSRCYCGNECYASCGDGYGTDDMECGCGE